MLVNYRKVPEELFTQLQAILNDIADNSEAADDTDLVGADLNDPEVQDYIDNFRI